MHKLLGHLHFVEVYLDDITIHSKTAQDHGEHIGNVLLILKQVTLKLNFAKCKWFAKRISY